MVDGAIIHNNPNIRAQDESIRRVLRKNSRIRLAILFGSLARNTATANSDIDLAVSADKPLDADDKMQLIMDLAETTGRPVDLVDLATVGEPLLGQIITGGRKVLGDNADHARLIYSHLLNEADFMPYRRRILRERRKAWIGA